MNVLVLTREGGLLPLAQRILDNGHLCRLYIQERPYWPRGDGIIDTSISKKQMLKGSTVVVGVVEELVKKNRPDLVVVGRGMGKVGDVFHVLGVPVWGNTKWADLINDSPDYAAHFLYTSDVTKQDVVCAGWWDGSHFLYHHTTRHTIGLMAGDVGVPVVSGCVVRMASPRTPRFQVTLGKIESILRKTHYRGPVAIGQTLRLGIELCEFAALFELLKGTLPEALMKGVDFTLGTGVAVHISIPPYPHSVSTYAPAPVGVDPGASKHVWLVDVVLKESAGIDGSLGWASARGKDLRECRRRVARTLLGLSHGIPNLQYRVDAV